MSFSKYGSAVHTRVYVTKRSAKARASIVRTSRCGGVYEQEAASIEDTIMYDHTYLEVRFTFFYIFFSRTTKLGRGCILADTALHTMGQYINTVCTSYLTSKKKCHNKCYWPILVRRWSSKSAVILYSHHIFFIKHKRVFAIYIIGDHNRPIFNIPHAGQIMI